MQLDWPDTGARLPKLSDFKSETSLVGPGHPGGVYLLFRDDTIVYVGQSSNLVERLRAHRKEKTKSFHTARVYLLDDEVSRLITEGILILYFRPEYNRGLNLGIADGRVWAVRWRQPK